MSKSAIFEDSGVHLEKGISTYSDTSFNERKQPRGKTSRCKKCTFECPEDLDPQAEHQRLPHPTSLRLIVSKKLYIAFAGFMTLILALIGLFDLAEYLQKVDFWPSDKSFASSPGPTAFQSFVCADRYINDRLAAFGLPLILCGYSIRALHDFLVEKFPLVVNRNRLGKLTAQQRQWILNDVKIHESGRAWRLCKIVVSFYISWVWILSIAIVFISGAMRGCTRLSEVYGIKW